MNSTVEWKMVSNELPPRETRILLIRKQTYPVTMYTIMNDMLVSRDNEPIEWQFTDNSFTAVAWCLLPDITEVIEQYENG